MTDIAAQECAVMAAHGPTPRASDRVPLACAAVFAAIWTILAIAPRYRADWWLENMLTFVAVPALVKAYRARRLSDASWIQITAFLVLHTIGSHYTYSEVPAGDWVRDALALGRNHYDRLVHFAFGLLLFRPIGEVLLPAARGRRPSGMDLYLTFTAVLSWSVLYELLEWLVAMVADPEAGTAYLGTQGDQWDAQKDMALASAGAILALVIEVVRERRAPSRSAPPR
jgi:putative membrane protein